MGGEQFQGMDLEQQRMEKQLSGGPTFRRILPQTLLDKVLLAVILQQVDGLPNVFLGHLFAGLSVADDLQCGHFQGAHSECVYVQSGTYG